MQRRRLLVLVVVLASGGVIVAVVGWRLYQRFSPSPTRAQLAIWINIPAARSALITNLTAPCPGAPFRLPAVGFVGFLYADPTTPYTPSNAHPGIDIFGD